MSNYDSDIEPDELDDIEDGDLKEEIEEIMNKEATIEYIETPDDIDEPVEPGEEQSDQEDAVPELDEIGDQKNIDACNELVDTALGEATIAPGSCTVRDHVQVKELVSVQDSRMPDIPTVFELTGMKISRVCSLVAGSLPLVPYEHYDPREIVVEELAAGQVLRAVLRGDCIWRWSDFTCMPRGFNSRDTAVSLHELR